jgi:hypothetical protein
MVDAMVEAETPTKTKYFIDTGSFERRGKSFRAIAQARFCPACRAKIGSETQERVTSIDPKTGRVTFEMKAVEFGSNPFAVIRSDCSRQRGYITEETPLMEAVFRVLLANANQPMDVDQIREELEQLVSPVAVGHGFATDILERLIATDNFYGIRAFQPGDAP